MSEEKEKGKFHAEESVAIVPSLPEVEKKRLNFMRRRLPLHITTWVADSREIQLRP